MNQATSSVRDPAGDQVQRALSAAIDRHGPALLREPDKLKAILIVAAPEATRVIGAIVTAVANRVPQSMLAAHSDDHLASILPGLVDRLMSVAPLDHGQATWIVRAWAQALALSAHGLDAPASSTVAAVAAAAVTVATDRRANMVEMLGSPVRPASGHESPANGREVAVAERQASVIEPAVTALAAVAPVAVSPAAPTTPPSAAPPDPGAASAPSVMSVKPRSRRPLAWIASVAAIALIIGIGGWRWMASRPAAVTPAADSPAIASAPAAPAPSIEPSTAETTTPSPAPATIPPPPPPPPPAATPDVPASVEAPLPATPPQPTTLGDGRTPSPSTVVPPKSPSRPSGVPQAQAAPTVAVPRPPAASPAAPALPPIASTSGDRAGLACTRASCGSVVSARALRDDGSPAQGAPTRGYEMTIRMDDRSIETWTQALPLRAGSRVRMVGNAFVPTSE